jgi:lactobin A/cerein 7B family class IIb bacteriocin
MKKETKMRELSLNEIEEVNGGNPTYIVAGVIAGGFAVGLAGAAFVAWYHS